MAISLELTSLLTTGEDLRDQDWEKAFLHVLPTLKLKVLNEAPQSGPDSWPYLWVSTEGGREPAGKVLEWLSDKGIGLAVNPQKAMPDYVLTYGMVWNYRRSGMFIESTPHVRSGQIKFDKDQKVLAGAPTEEYLPSYARNILRDFFKQQKLDAVKILVMGEKDKSFDLCFSLESLGSPDRTEHRGILETIAWFLPSHYSLLLVSEKGLPAFVAL